MLKGLNVPGRSPNVVLDEAIERAIARGTLLALLVHVGDVDRTWLFPNSDRGRRAIARLRAGTLRVENVVVPDEMQSQPTEQPNIFALYEQNIGLLQPLIAEELREAEKTYPQDWVEMAFRIAAQRNVRHWRYVRAILERWASKGMDSGKNQRYTEEEWRRHIEQEFIESVE